MASTQTERTIYVAVFVVEHEPGLGKELDHADPPDAWRGVRANFVEWLDGATVYADYSDDDFYRVRDVTLYSDDDFIAELREHGSIDRFPQVDTRRRATASGWEPHPGEPQ